MAGQCVSCSAQRRTALKQAACCVPAQAGKQPTSTGPLDPGRWRHVEQPGATDERNTRGCHTGFPRKRLERAQRPLGCQNNWDLTDLTPIYDPNLPVPEFMDQ